MPVERVAVLRRARWLLLVVPAADVLLAVADVLPVRAAVAAGLALEVLLAGVSLAEAAVLRSAYRAARGRGADRTAAVLAGADAALPGPVAFVVRSEVGMVRALWWAVRRRRCGQPGDRAFSCTSRIGLVLWAVLGLGVLEVVAVHLLLPWPPVRWVVLAVSLYGLLWLLAFNLSLRQHPHTLAGDVLTVRFAHLRAVDVPLAHLVAVRSGSRLGHRRDVEVRDGELSLSVMGETDVELAFDPPAPVRMGGRLVSAHRVRLFADDPRALVRALDLRFSDPKGPAGS